MLELLRRHRLDAEGVARLANAAHVLVEAPDDVLRKVFLFANEIVIPKYAEQRQHTQAEPPRPELSNSYSSYLMVVVIVPSINESELTVVLVVLRNSPFRDREPVITFPLYGQTELVAWCVSLQRKFMSMNEPCNSTTYS